MAIQAETHEIALVSNLSKVKPESAETEEAIEAHAGGPALMIQLGVMSEVPRPTEEADGLLDVVHDAGAPSLECSVSAQSSESEGVVDGLAVDPATQVLARDRTMTSSKKGTFLMCDGALPIGDDILVERMSISKARAKCREFDGCMGFTYEVVDGEPLVHFKRRWELRTIPGEVWISYRYVKAEPLEEEESADVLIHRALQPDSQVGFPQITEICDRLEAEPEEIRDAVSLLVGVLRGPESFQLKLKTLTIISEMLYNIEVVPWFTMASGFFSAIKELRGACNTALGETAESSIRMLATEIGKVCVDSDSLSSCSSSSSWSGSGRLWNLASGLKSNSLRKKLKSAVTVTGSGFKNSAQRSFEATLKVASPHLPVVHAFLGMKAMGFH